MQLISSLEKSTKPDCCGFSFKSILFASSSGKNTLKCQNKSFGFIQPKSQEINFSSRVFAKNFAQANAKALMSPDLFVTFRLTQSPDLFVTFRLTQSACSQSKGVDYNLKNVRCSLPGSAILSSTWICVVYVISW